MYCPKCGRQIDNNSIFCPFCGQKADVGVSNAKPVASIDKAIGNQAKKWVIGVVVGLVAVTGVTVGAVNVFSDSDDKEPAIAEVDKGEPVITEETLVETATTKEPVEESDKENLPIILDYSVTHNDFSHSIDGGKKVVMYFDRIIFEGSDEGVINWLNGQIESLENSYQKDCMEDVEHYAENLQGDQHSTQYDISPHELKHVYYDDDYVSIGWNCSWYAGGVADTSFTSVNYDLNSKIILSVRDLLGDNAYNIIIEALNKEDESGFLSNSFEHAMLDSVPFYFDADTVYINFPDNMLGVSWPIEITVPRLVKN